MTASLTRFLTSLRDLPRAYTWTSLLVGLLAVIVAFSGPVLIVLQAAQSARLTPEQTTSFVWAVVIGSGLMSIFMSLWYRMPVLGAWSTPGVVLLISSLGLYEYHEAIGAFVLAGAGVMLLGLTGWYSRVLRLVPTPIIMGMLAGVLLHYGADAFGVLPENPLMVIAMIAVFFVLRRRRFRAPTLGALLAGLVIAGLSGLVSIPPLDLAFTQPVFTAPTFTFSAALGIGLPLFILAITSQNAPGLAVLQNYGYTLPIDSMLIFTGFASMLLAPFGGPGINLAAITASMVASPEAHPRPQDRYTASLSTGLGYVLFGTFSAAAVTVFSALPHALMATVAGLALLGTITSAMTAAVEKPETRDAGVVALLCTAANFNLLGIGAPFWGLVFGLLVHAIYTLRRRSAAAG
jgi:benzoate membrane transport protein